MTLGGSGFQIFGEKEPWRALTKPSIDLLFKLTISERPRRPLAHKSKRVSFVQSDWIQGRMS